jgi:hypothetical protein
VTPFPKEFSDLLSARGRRVLAGKDAGAKGALADAPFFSGGGLLDARWVKAAPKILDRAFTDVMVEMTQRAPAATASVLDTGTEKLPKIGRVLTNVFTPETEVRAEACGLVAMVSSPSYQAFVEVLTQRKMRGPDKLQVLCYRPGDYAGPHTDHHPQSPAPRNGYVDIHLTFTTAGVAHQYLVYGPEGHLDQVQSVTEGGTVTAYRLPFWHYVTPLVTKTTSARRWLVLGTFLFD